MNDTITPAIVRKHKWDRDHERRLDGSTFADGNARTERDCIHCAMTKITVHPVQGLPWREWRTKNGDLWVGTATPPCLEGEQI